jgi:uncharacterized DUF497 family protein
MKRVFEYDVNKSASNLEKHGIDFEEAKALWNDEKKVTVESAHKQEPREVMFASMGGKVYAAVYTVRGNAIRIISVRRAHDKEVRLYGKSDIGRGF